MTLQVNYCLYFNDENADNLSNLLTVTEIGKIRAPGGRYLC